MGFFNNWPYTNFHELNLDWLLSQMKALGSAFDAFVETNVLKYSDPIAWSITSQYEPNTIVSNGTDVYLSKQAVPAGVAITNTDYWFQVGDLSTYQLQLDLIRHQITADDEGSNVNASQSYATGDVFWLNGYLSQASQTIAAGAPFVMGSNYDRVTVIDLFDDLTASVNTSISSITNVANTAMAVSGAGRKRVICIGDSISQGYNPDGDVTGWSEVLRTRLGLTLNVDYFVAHKGGAGIVQAGQGKTFLQLLQDLTPSVSNPETITDIYLVGGVNDALTNVTVSAASSAMGTFCDYAAANFPNAVLHVGCIAMTNHGNIPGEIAQIHQGYRYGCRKNAEFIYGIIGAMCRYTGYASDGIHVTQETENRLAECIITGMGYFTQFNGNITANTALVSNACTPYCTIDGGNLYYWFVERWVTVNDTTTVKANMTWFKAGTIVDTNMFGLAYSANGGDNIQEIQLNGMIFYSGSWRPATIHFRAYNGEWQCAIQATDGANYIAGGFNRFVVYSGSGSVPAI